MVVNIEDFEIFLEDFRNFLDALEASIVKMRQQIAKLEGVSKRTKLECEALDRMDEQIKRLKTASLPLLAEEKPKREWSWNPDKIKWEKAEGQKGEFERSEDFNNPEFKAMLKDLAKHDGKLTRDGFFYWVYRNGSTVGRKRRG